MKALLMAMAILVSVGAHAQGDSAGGNQTKVDKKTAMKSCQAEGKKGKDLKECIKEKTK